MQGAWWIYFVIFIGKLAEVSLASLRSQLIIRGERLGGVFISALEYLFWFFITATALDKFADDPLMIALLVVAFSLGQALGSIVEEKLALGLCQIHCIFTDEDSADRAAESLREKGFALTVFVGKGMREEQRPVLFLTLKRNQVQLVRKTVRDIDSSVVITLTPSVRLEGGTIASRTR